MPPPEHSLTGPGDLLCIWRETSPPCSLGASGKSQTQISWSSLGFFMLPICALEGGKSKTPFFFFCAQAEWFVSLSDLTQKMKGKEEEPALMHFSVLRTRRHRRRPTERPTRGTRSVPPSPPRSVLHTFAQRRRWSLRSTAQSYLVETGATGC